MAGIVVFLLVNFQVFFDLFQGAYRYGNCNELATLFGINAFGQSRNGFIGIFLCHSEFFTFRCKGTNKMTTFVQLKEIMR